MSTPFLRSRGALGACLISVMLAAPRPARAEGLDLQRFQPSERGSSWFVLESLDMRGHARPAAGAVFDYQRRPLVIRESDGSIRAAVVDNVLTAHVGGALVLADRVRASVNLPVVLLADGEQGTLRGVTYAPPQDKTTLGDARIGVDARLFGAHDGPITMAVGARLWVPTGSPSSYSGDGSVRFSPHVLAAGTVSMFTYAARAGVVVRNPDTATFSEVGTELVYGVSGGVKVADSRVTIGPELFGGTTLADNAFKTRTSPLEVLLGGHYAHASGLRFGAGVGAGVVSGLGAPQLRALGTIEWSPEIVADADGDGVPDADDACRNVAGVRSAERAKNGCPPEPPPPDTDGDGIADKVDACPDVRGEETNDPRTNGCVDRDGDGIMDPIDRCPFAAGPKSSDPLKHGCPDTDGDGFVDAEDGCPDMPGVKSSDPKTNGCPANTSPDRDEDGIPNEKDACPDQPGKPDAAPSKNGCPVAFVDGGQIRIRQQVKFKVASAQIDPGKDSAEVLQAVLEILKAHPEIQRVRVEGHTDNRGDPKANQKLSQARAAAVVTWLVGKGIDKQRLTSVGFGMERPLDANDTEEGRQNNRRVELHIEASGDAPAAPAQ